MDKYINLVKDKNYQLLNLSKTSYLVIIKNWKKSNKDILYDYWKLCPKGDQYVKIFGKTIKIPRKNDLYSINKDIVYTFSGQTTKSKLITKDNLMDKLLEEFNMKIKEDIDYLIRNYKTFENTIEGNCNAIFINWYKDGTEYIGPHADDEKDLDTDFGIWSLSIGDVRKFKITNKITNQLIKEIELEDGTLIGMFGDFQKEFKHAVPKKKNGSQRINFTFRKFIV